MDPRAEIIALWNCVFDILRLSSLFIILYGTFGRSATNKKRQCLFVNYVLNFECFVEKW